MKPLPRPYRAMKIGTEEWVEGCYEIDWAGFDRVGGQLIQKETLGQSTGESDQLSQPLWQDDVVKDLRGARWLIIWKKGAFWLENMETKCRWLLDGGKAEKVGTIYDSPAKLYGKSEAKHQGDDNEGLTSEIPIAGQNRNISNRGDDDEE